MTSKKIAYAITRNAKTVSVLCARVAKRIDGSPVAWITDDATAAALMVTSLTHVELFGSRLVAALKDVVVELSVKFYSDVTAGKRMTFCVKRDAMNPNHAWSMPLSNDEMRGLRAFRKLHDIDAETPIIVELGNCVENADIDTSADNVEVVYMDALIVAKPEVTFQPKAPAGIIQTTPIKSSLTVSAALANALSQAKSDSVPDDKSSPADAFIVTNRHVAAPCEPVHVEFGGGDDNELPAPTPKRRRHRGGRNKNTGAGQAGVKDAGAAPKVEEKTVAVNSVTALPPTPSTTLLKDKLTHSPFDVLRSNKGPDPIVKRQPQKAPIAKTPSAEPKTPAMTDTEAMPMAVALSGLSTEEFAGKPHNFQMIYIRKVKAANQG
jgi:hypothetical protein